MEQPFTVQETEKGGLVLRTASEFKPLHDEASELLPDRLACKLAVRLSSRVIELGFVCTKPMVP